MAIISRFTLWGLLILFYTGCSLIHIKNTHHEQRSADLANKFVIYAYGGPPLGEVNIERYREVAHAGIDVLIPGNGTFSTEQNLKALKMAQQAGIRIIPLDTSIYPASDDTYKDSLIIRKLIYEYKDHPAFAGYALKDEPNAELFPAMKTISDIFRAKDPRHETFINLFPSYGSPTQLGFNNFRAYIRNYIETVKPGILSYDFYALREGSTLYNSWYNDLKIVREETQKVHIPFIIFLQSEGIKGYLRVPNRAEILWQANTALAYGARGVEWFTYWTPAPDQGFNWKKKTQPALIERHYNAMIDTNGRRTEIYYYVRETNLYLKKAGKGLTSYKNTQTSRYESGKLLGGDASPYLTPSGEEANLVIGTFKKDDRIRIVISNSSCEKPAKFFLNISPHWKWDGIFTAIDAYHESGKQSTQQWILGPGGSVLVDIKPL